MPYPERIETERLVLRRWRDEDADDHAAIWAQPEIWSALRPEPSGDPTDTAAKSFVRMIDHWERNGFGLWATIDPADDDVIGWVGAWYPDFVPAVAGEIEIGWTLHPDYWGRGLATEGARAAIDAAFSHLQPARLISLIAPGNARSIAVATRLGMNAASQAVSRDGVTLRVYELPAP